MLRYCALLSLFVGLFAFAAPTTVYAQDETPAAEETEETPAADESEADADDADADAAEVDLSGVSPDELDIEHRLEWMINIILMFICAVLVIFMQAGFSMVEAGFNSAKNTVNILSKNVMDLCVGVLLYFFVGWGLMYPGAYAGEENPAWNGYVGFGGVGVAFGEPISAPEQEEGEDDAAFAKRTEEYYKGDNVLSAADVVEASDGDYAVTSQVDFFFQVAFAATAATIVSGAVAGRMKFTAYLVYSAVLTGFIYPISGSWKWGTGWLDAMGFHDFAGSLIVHALGGFAGLAGAIVLGPRIGRYSEDGKSQPMPGHNIAIATLGVFILFVGWFGFNPGSILTYYGAEATTNTALVAVNTLLAGCAGGVTAIALAWIMFGKPDLSMALNGVLGGLVGITANADIVSNMSSIPIGGIAGVLVVLGVMMLDKLKIDDPVGAWPVHGLCGIWGGIACAIFGGKDFVAQIVGSIAIPVWAFVTMLVLFMGLKAVGMLRVSAEEETRGLDISEHGMHAYLTT